MHKTMKEAGITYFATVDGEFQLMNSEYVLLPKPELR